MPTYDYKCDACGHAFEKFQSISAPALKKCPECGKSRVKRLIGTGAGIIFKGGGFYETDYRSESYNAAAKKESGQSADSGKTSGGESKPAAQEKPAPAATPPKSEPTKKKSA